MHTARRFLLHPGAVVVLLAVLAAAGVLTPLATAPWVGAATLLVVAGAAAGFANSGST